MSWAPTQQVVNLTPVIDNIFGYIADNQADAHSWANDGDSMPDYTLYTSIVGRTTTKFPQLSAVAHGHKGEEGETANGDVLIITFALIFEGAVSGRNTDDLVVQARRYAHALESMLANIPTASISTDIVHSYLESYSTDFDELGRGGINASSWLQIFRTRADFKLITGAY